MAVELVYETHCTSTDNEAGIATGWLPGRLSTTGRQQARELGARRRDGVVAGFSSDLHRAVQTAQIAFAGSGIPIHQDARLRECNYGTFNGAPVTQLAAQRRHHIRAPFPEGESYQQVVDRTAEFLRDLIRDWNGQRVVVIAHSANRWALDVLVHRRRLSDLVDAPFGWQPGWIYQISADDQGAGYPRP
jgi:alpha-ribazole phosphatase/probable phosphoglycerate mutase